MDTPHTPENWGAASRGYAKLAPRMMGAFAEALVERLDPAPQHDAIEVAAGTGVLTFCLAPRVRALLATDFSPGMIQVLQEGLAAAGLADVRCEVMDGQALACDDASFDRAACSFALMLFPDRAKGFAEVRRVLRPGGRAAVSGWAGPPEFDAFAIFLHALETAFPDMPPPPGPPPVFSLADPTAFAAEMKAAGFTDVRVDKVTRVFEVGTFDELWAMLTAGAPPVKVLFDRVGEGGKDRVRDTLSEIVEVRFGSGPIRLNNTATIGYGVVA